MVTAHARNTLRQAILRIEAASRGPMKPPMLTVW